MLAAFISLIVSFVREDSPLLERKEGWFLLLQRSTTITWSRDMVWWKCKQPGCGCRVMETLPRGSGWKLMTTGGAARAQVLDSCRLAHVGHDKVAVLAVFTLLLRQISVTDDKNGNWYNWRFRTTVTMRQSGTFAVQFSGSRQAVMERAGRKIKFVWKHTADSVGSLQDTVKEVAESVFFNIFLSSFSLNSLHNLTCLRPFCEVSVLYLFLTKIVVVLHLQTFLSTYFSGRLAGVFLTGTQAQARSFSAIKGSSSITCDAWNIGRLNKNLKTVYTFFLNHAFSLLFTWKSPDIIHRDATACTSSFTVGLKGTMKIQDWKWRTGAIVSPSCGFFRCFGVLTVLFGDRTGVRPVTILLQQFLKIRRWRPLEVRPGQPGEISRKRAVKTYECH